jgi:hypothetical protein
VREGFGLLLSICGAALIETVLSSTGHADTTTALGDRTGEGSTPFTGLAQSPEANLFTGAMGTSIKIDIPPGRKSVTPSLALVYSSAGGPSPYGYGWDLPLGRISRSTKWGVPDCNGAHADDFILSMPSGTVELIAESPGSNYYRPKIEEAYLRAQKSTASNSWVLYDRSGLKYVFGDQAAARTGSGTSQFLTTVSWALTRIEDPNGNAVDISYVSDYTTADNITYPASIDYGGKNTSSHFYHVKFQKPDGTSGYENRPDPIESDLSGARAILRKRLTTITVTTDIPSPNTSIRSYTLTYDTPDNPTTAGSSTPTATPHSRGSCRRWPCVGANRTTSTLPR